MMKFALAETMAGNGFEYNKIELAYKEYLTQHTNCNQSLYILMNSE